MAVGQNKMPNQTDIFNLQCVGIHYLDDSFCLLILPDFLMKILVH